MTDDDELLYEARGLAKDFAGRNKRVHALDDVDFVLRRGKSLGIVGESGAGKSTLLNILLGFEAPSAGHITYRGEVLDPGNRVLMRQLRHEVQIVFQDPRSSLDPRMRVAAIVAEPLRSLKIPGDHSAIVRDVLVAVGLDPAAVNRYPHEFSGGQRQRIAIARALGPSPRILLADEPVSALDVTVRTQILDLLESLKQRFGLTLVLVSHDLAVVARLCDHILVLKEGRIVESGNTGALFSNPQSAYTRKLLDSVLSLPVVAAGKKA